MQRGLSMAEFKCSLENSDNIFSAIIYLYGYVNQQQMEITAIGWLRIEHQVKMKYFMQQ